MTSPRNFALCVRVSLGRPTNACGRTNAGTVDNVRESVLSTIGLRISAAADAR
jgi:hypothetical protein